MTFNKEQNIAYQKVAFLCSKSEKCSFDIIEKLREMDLSKEDSLAIIDKLKSEKYLDDERYAFAFVKDKFRFNHWGKQKIAYILKSKNIASEIIEKAFDGIDEEDYSDELRKILTDKARTVKGKDKYEIRNKLMRFAIGRGFEAGQIQEILKEMGI